VQELFAVVVIVLPGVLPVQDYAGQVRPRGTFLLQPGVDVVEPLDEVARRFLTRHAGVGEADLVRDHQVAEDDGHRTLVVVAHIVGAVEQVGLLDRLLAVAGETVQPQRAGQHLLAGGHPHQPCVGHHLDDVLRHRPFGRPHAARVLAKNLAVALDPALDLGDGVLGIGEALW